MQLHFYKYQGTGNDFIIIDNRNGQIQLSQEQIEKLCHRRFGIGADGLMYLQSKEGFDFEMKYFNADGKEGSMCGNGGRCLTQFAYDAGIQKDHFHFMATDGLHEAKKVEGGWISLKMKEVHQVQLLDGNAVLNTGSPHYVKAIAHLDEYDVFEEGRKIRYSPSFQQEGINVNFVEALPNGIHVRTYERGVEDETYSCGTGVTAASLVFGPKELGEHRMEVLTKGGNLAVSFEKKGEQDFINIWLSGPAQFVFEGTFHL